MMSMRPTSRGIGLTQMIVGAAIVVVALVHYAIRIWSSERCDCAPSHVAGTGILVAGGVALWLLGLPLAQPTLLSEDDEGTQPSTARHTSYLLVAVVVVLIVRCIFDGDPAHQIEIKAWLAALAGMGIVAKSVQRFAEGSGAPPDSGSGAATAPAADSTPTPKRESIGIPDADGAVE